MRCLHNVQYKSVSKNIEVSSTIRRGCLAEVYAIRNIDDDNRENIIVKSYCSGHNHEKYNDIELTGLIKFKDIPNEILEKALNLFQQGQNVNDIVPQLILIFEKYIFLNFPFSLLFSH